MSESDQETLRAAFVRLFGEGPRVSANSAAVGNHGHIARQHDGRIEIRDGITRTVWEYGTPDWRQNLARAEAAVMAAREIK